MSIYKAQIVSALQAYYDNILNPDAELTVQEHLKILVEIIEFLLTNGAKKDAKMNVYGGEFTAYELFTTSAHPINSGINTSISELLKF